MHELPELSAADVQRATPRVLVRCAVCECDQALVRSHAAADRVLETHLATCPGNTFTLGG